MITMRCLAYKMPPPLSIEHVEEIHNGMVYFSRFVCSFFVCVSLLIFTVLDSLFRLACARSQIGD